MVCLGNICRSPLAEGILQKKADEAGFDWIVESAGTNGLHDGEAPHQLSQKIALSHGIDISQQVSRQIVAADFKNYDRIYAMATDVLSDLQRKTGDSFDPAKTMLFLDVLYPGELQNVPDPWYGGEDGYIEVYDLIDKACTAIITHHFETLKQTSNA